MILCKYTHYLKDKLLFHIHITKESCNFYQDGESGSEIGADVGHSQTSLPPNIHIPDQTSFCSAATSGAKPKAGVSTKIVFDITHSLNLEMK